jgi:hypothetical protein
MVNVFGATSTTDDVLPGVNLFTSSPQTTNSSEGA